jgi:hypothetical protein
VRGDAAPLDVTAEAMPAMPPLTEADRARQLAREGRITLDHSKLQYGPAMRWFVQYPETAQKGGPRAFSDWNREHLHSWSGPGTDSSCARRFRAASGPATRWHRGIGLVAASRILARICL